MSPVDAPSSVDHLLAILATGVREFDDPGLDVLSHSLQCAAILYSEGADHELVAAGLLHDIADAAFPHHDEHDRRGAELVRPVIGTRVAALVGGHVRAKRYLVTTDPQYRSSLSERSVATLLEQGDLLSDAEVAAFDADPERDALVILRRADERAKVVGATVPDLEHWRPLLASLAHREP